MKTIKQHWQWNKGKNNVTGRHHGWILAIPGIDTDVDIMDNLIIITRSPLRYRVS